MIDWVNAVMPYRHHQPINQGGVIFIDEHGEVGSFRGRKRQVRGSYDSTCMIQTSSDHPADPVTGERTHIWISASPKFLQGHNLFGIDCPVRLASLIAQKALKALGHGQDPFSAKKLTEQARIWEKLGDMKFTILDLTEMWAIGTPEDSAAFLEAACDRIKVRYRGAGEYDKGTIYIGKHSRNWALKLYDKFREINSKSKKHRLPADIPERDQLLNYAYGTVRCEIRLLSMELKRQGLQHGHAWLNTTAQQVRANYMKNIDIKANIELREHQLHELPVRLQAVYALWADGNDLFSLYPKVTLWRYRKQLLVHGIDIARKPAVKGSKVISLHRVLEARPMGIPAWALNTSLLAA